MLEIKITAPELAEAMNNLASAIKIGKVHTVCNQNGANNQQIENVGTLNMGKAQIPVSAPANAPRIASAPGYAPAPIPTAPMPQAPTSTIPVAPTMPAPASAPIPTVPTVPRAITSTPQTAPVASQPQPTAYAPVSPTVPTSAPQYTLDMIATAGAALFDAGKGPQLQELLRKYGVHSITELKPEQYGPIATDLRAMGARI